MHLQTKFAQNAFYLTCKWIKSPYFFSMGIRCNLFTHFKSQPKSLLTGRNAYMSIIKEVNMLSRKQTAPNIMLLNFAFHMP